MTAQALYYSDPVCMEHDPRGYSPGHPDTPERLMILERALAERAWMGWTRANAERAHEDQLALVHTREHVRAIRELCAAGGGAIDADTFVGEPSYAAALAAAGCACAMTRALVDGRAAVAFCGVRPAGHHAEGDRAMGFCLFNNVAVAAACAIVELGLDRVLVLDWDVHHGNGTAEIFRARADVLFASIHQSPLYPGTGPLRDVGSGAGEGFTINLPVAPGSAEPEWLALLDRVVLPAAAHFKPQLVLVSAGFDAHVEDPLADCALRTSSFVKMAARTRDLAARVGAPLGLVLEGGYHPRVLADCVCAILPVLAGERDAPRPDDEDDDGGGPSVDRAVAALSPFWPL